MAFRAIGRMDREQLGRTIAAAQADVEARGEKYTGPSYTGGTAQKSSFPVKQMAQLGPERGAFGGPLNQEKADESAKRAKELAQMWATQWSNGPFGLPVAGAPVPEPNSKETA